MYLVNGSNVHVVDQDVHVVDQDVAVDDGEAIHDVRCDSNFCVSMIVNDRDGLGAIVLDVHQDGGEVRANIDGINVCHLIGGGSVRLKNQLKEGQRSNFLESDIGSLGGGKSESAGGSVELGIRQCEL
jgi:hypothetical protein